MGRKALVIAAVAAVVAATALPAKACSCAVGDPRDELARADGAFVGTLLSRRPAVDPDLQTDVFTFQVDEAVKGEYPETFDVHSASDGAACGLEVDEGEQTGLLLYFHEDDGQWWSNLCSQMSPEDLREAAAPLPDPDGRGPVRVLVGGTWGEAGHLALDGRGRTLGYGLGDHLVVDLEVCPRARRLVEVYLEGRRLVVAVRRLASNRLLWHRELPRLARGEAPVEVWCPGRSGDAVLVAGGSGGRRHAGHVWRLTEDHAATLYRGVLRDAAFASGGTVYLQRGDRGESIVALRGYGSGGSRRVATVPAGSLGLELSPDGRRLATKSGAVVAVVDVVSGRTRTKRVAGARSGEVLWWRADRLVIFPSSGRSDPIVVLDQRLRDARRLAGSWQAFESTVAGDVGYGLGYRSVFRVRLRRGRAERVRSFPTYSLYAIEGVPGQTRIDWPDPPD